MEIDLAFGIPDGIVPELKKKYVSEKEYDLRVTKANPLTTPYFPWGDPRSKPDVMKFEGKDYWVYKANKGVRMNWVYEHDK